MGKKKSKMKSCSGNVSFSDLNIPQAPVSNKNKASSKALLSSSPKKSTKQSAPVSSEKSTKTVTTEENKKKEDVLCCSDNSKNCENSPTSPCESSQVTASPSTCCSEKSSASVDDCERSLSNTTIPSDDTCCSTKETGCCSEKKEKPETSKPSSCGSKASGCCSTTSKEEQQSSSSCCASTTSRVDTSIEPKASTTGSSCCSTKETNEASCCSSKGPDESTRPVARKKSPSHSSSRISSRSKRSIDAELLRLCIGGMTCTGCCTRIESFLTQQPGIVSVNTSLLTNRGDFMYDPAVTTPQQIEEKIRHLGFTSNPMPSDSMVALVVHVNQDNLDKARKILLSVEGVSCANVNTIGKATEQEESVVRNGTALPVRNVLPGQKKASLLIEYDPEIIGARTLLKEASSQLGYQLHATTPEPQALLNEQEEVMKFRRLLLWSCILSTPIILIQYLFPIIYHNAITEEPFETMIIEGLSIKDAIGFVCATPILFVIAYPIHESAYAALRFSSRVTMDVLISLSSSVAYFFSVGILIVQILVGSTTTHSTTSEVLNEKEVKDTLKNQSETFFEVTSLLITLILVGRYIEKIVKAKASNSIDALLRIQAKTAILLEEDVASSRKESYIDIILVERNDLLKILPGARVPTDGIVVEGESTIDESMITGESRKVYKEKGSMVIGGTINSQGVLIMRVTHTISESMLARIVHLVDEAQSSKCASQSLADVIASYFTSFIITVAVVMFFVWYELARLEKIDTNGWQPFPFALRFAITILVISCPCAISLAVPTAIMVATTIGSHFGVLFKSGQALEKLEKVDVVIFDKTGTITSGKLQVVDDLNLLRSISLREDQKKKAWLWNILGVVEQNSEHAIGKAIYQHVQKLRNYQHPLPPTAIISPIRSRSNDNKTTTITSTTTPSSNGSPHTSPPTSSGPSTPISQLVVEDEIVLDQFEAVAGCGVKCLFTTQEQQQVEKKQVAVGSFKWIHEVLHIGISAEALRLNEQLQKKGLTVVCVTIENELEALIGFKDQPREEALFVVQELRKAKLQTWIVTGDQVETAVSIGEKVCIPHFTVLAGALPHEKVEKVRLLQSIGKTVAFIGDGINDGPALAAADVGIAIGAGTDVAIESADVVLVKDDLRDLLNALSLSKATNRLIRWNFGWGFMYNLTMMPLACGALYPFFGISIPPAFAGLSELLSSVPVILFSLLLNYWRPPIGQDRLVVPKDCVAIEINTPRSSISSSSTKDKKPTEKTPLLLLQPK